MFRTGVEDYLLQAGNRKLALLLCWLDCLLAEAGFKFTCASSPRPQVDVAVVTQVVSVQHDCRSSPAALAAALNTAHLEASLTPPRPRAGVGGAWVPPAHLLAAAALLLVSCIQYLHKPTGAAGCMRPVSPSSNASFCGAAGSSCAQRCA